MPHEEMVMANYTVENFENGIATVRYADESWAEIVVTDNMTEQDFDDLAFQFAPKQGAVNAPSFLSVGSQRTAAQKPEEEVATEEATYITQRQNAYGSPEAQIEFIVENGLEAWQAEVQEIKALYPKP